MKLLVKEYLSALKERGELDAVLPDLLSQMGLHVFSRPAIGTRQNGVDLAAVGLAEDGVKKVFLFTVKAGNLTRADWNGTIQAVRPSLDEIIDSYIPRRIPTQYSGLPVVVCVCVGGDVDQSVDSDLSDYETRRTAPGIAFERWDGDHIANLMLSAVLGENIISGEARSYFRKSVAMLDEPEAAYGYFAEMIGKLNTSRGTRQKDLVTFVRQLNLCCWVLYVWARQAENLEAPYRCSELALLWVWDATSSHLEKSTAPANAMRSALTSLQRLHINMANELVMRKYLPHAAIRDGLASAVNSSFSLDVNLRLFDAIGRIALTGIWIQFFTERNSSIDASVRQQVNADLDQYANGLVGIISNNRALSVPVLDSHSIEVNLVCAFLSMRGREDAVRNWVGQLLQACIFAIRTNKQYPCTFADYYELANHPRPRSDEDYFKRATAGSTLIPTLCIWHKLTEPAVQFSDVLEFIQKNIPHCTQQLWVPDETSEQNFYTNAEAHGLAVLGLPITETCDELLEIVFEECRQSDANFNSLSAIRLGEWPIILTACRHHRQFVPLNFWRDFETTTAADVPAQCEEHGPEQLQT